MANISRLSVGRAPARMNWTGLVLIVVGFWLSSSLLLDFLMMPMMYASGMMSEPHFATAGYSMFWLFNRVEVLCAATALSGLLVVRWQQRNHSQQFAVLDRGASSRWAMALGTVLLAIALICTYLLTPEMSALGIHLSNPSSVATFSSTVPGEMNYLHFLYWALEVLKLCAAGLLAKLCYHDLIEHT